MKNNFMHMKFLLASLCLLWGLPAMAQRNLSGEIYDYSSVNRAKATYNLSYSSIFVQFQPKLTNAEKLQVLTKAGIKVEDVNTLTTFRPKQDAAKVSLEYTKLSSPAALKELLSKLEADPMVVAANPYISWAGNMKPQEEELMGVTSEFYVKLKPTTSLDELRALVAVTNTTIKEQYRFAEGIYILTADKNARGNALEMANQFYESTKFEYAAVDFDLAITFEGGTPIPVSEEEAKKLKGIKGIKGTTATVNDPLWPWQYSHRITAAGIPGGQYPASVNEARAAFPGLAGPRPSDMAWNVEASMRVDEAWDIATTAGQGVRVAVIDNGVDINHPDLVANIAANGFDPANPANLGDAVGTVTGDHGTTCAGVIAAVANNSIGVAGVAHRATIVPIQVFTTDNVGLAAAVDWSWQPANGNADVSSNSYGFPAANNNPNFDIPVITDAFNRALTLGRGGRGQVVIASAGNSNVPRSGYPARIPGIISSIASNAGATRAGFSQFGQWADVASPGNQILTTDRRDVAPFQGFTSGEYCLIDGTSFSCPNAAGVAALIVGVNNNLTREQVRGFMEGTARKVAAGSPYLCNSEPNGSWGQQLGYGIIDSYEAVKQAQATLSSVCEPTFYSTPQGAFGDGSFSANYRKGLNCLYTISIPATSRIRVDFNQFDLAPGDRLEVYYNNAGIAPAAAVFTSANPATSVATTTGAISFRFITQANSATAQGWSVCYKADDRPDGDYTVNNTSGCLGSTFTFTPSVAPLSTVNEFRWNFGAGAVPQTATTTSITPVTATYTTPGTKTVTLTLVGPAGSTDVTKANFINVITPIATPFTETFPVPGNPPGWTTQPATGDTWLTQSGLPVTLRGGGFAESPVAPLANGRAISFLAWNFAAGTTANFVSPPMNLTAMTTPHLVFNLAHQPFGLFGAVQDRMQVQVSTDCGATWTTVYDKQSTNTNPNLNLATVPSLTLSEFRPQNANQWRREVVPLPMAAGRGSVQVRFVGISNFGNNIFVDDINVTNVVPPGAVNIFGSATTAPLVATPISGSEIRLTWSDNSPSETGLLVQRTTTPGNAASYTNVAILPPNTSSYIDAGLANNTAYTYRLFALNGSEVSSAAVTNLPIVAPVAGTEAFSLIARATTLSGTVSIGGNLITEPFTGCALPAGWTHQRTSGGATETWQFGSPTNLTTGAFAPVIPVYGTNPNFSGCYAFFDSDASSNDGLAEDISLVSPTINATGMNNVSLSFNMVFSGQFGGRIRVDVSNDGGTSWTNVFDRGAGSATPVTTHTQFNPIIPLPQIANTANGRIRFRWTGNWSMAVAIDNVSVLNLISGPTNLTANNTLNPANAVLNWTDNTTGETGFEIERSTTSASTGFTVVGTAAANATTFTHTNGVLVGAVNWYRVRARMSATQTTDYTNVASVTTVAAPTNLVVTPANVNPFGFNLTWNDNAANEGGYVVERSLSLASGFTAIATLPANSTSHTDFGTSSENTRYFYRVAAITNNFLSEYTNTGSGVTGLTAPSDASAAGFSPRANTISWKDNSNAENGYRIEASAVGGGVGFYSAGFAPANSTSFVHAGLAPDTRLFYRVQPVGLLGEIPVYTNEATATTYPAQPTNLMARGLNSSSIALSWIDNSTTELGYEIWRSTSATGAYVLVDRVPRPNMNSFTDNTVTHNVQYFYKVRAFRETNALSDESNIAVAVTMFDAPVLRLVVAANKRIVLEWTNNTPDVEGFILERTSMLDNNTPTGFVIVATISRGATTYTDNDVQPGTTYFYRLRAFNNTTRATSANSNVVSARLTPGIPSTPLNLTGVAGNGQVMLSWNAIADLDLANYEVYYFSENTLRKLAGTTKDTKMTIGGLENGILHTFSVRAINTTGLRSESSNTVELRPSIILSNNDDLVAASFNVYPNPNEGSFKLTFSKDAKPTMLTVTNTAGQVVFEKSISDFSGSEDINLSNVAAGIYIVNIVTEKASYQRRVSVIK